MTEPDIGADGDAIELPGLIPVPPEEPEIATLDHVSVPPDTVVLDTDAFSILFVRSPGGREQKQQLAETQQRLKDLLVGRTVVIATQTQAELIAGPQVGNWGERRTTELRRIVNDTPIVPVTAEVIETYARLAAACRNTGHALGQKDHASDRWIAATAIALGVPLLAVDRIYAGTPGLTFLT